MRPGDEWCTRAAGRHIKLATTLITRPLQNTATYGATMMTLTTRGPPSYPLSTSMATIWTASPVWLGRATGMIRTWWATSTNIYCKSNSADNNNFNNVSLYDHLWTTSTNSKLLISGVNYLLKISLKDSWLAYQTKERERDRDKKKWNDICSCS